MSTQPSRYSTQSSAGQVTTPPAISLRDESYTNPAHLQIAAAPFADPAAIVIAGNARFTILTSRLIRMEYHPCGSFEDRPSQAFWFRKQPVPAFSVKQSGDLLRIETEHLILHYQPNAPFSSENLSIRLRGSDVAWHYGDRDNRNLGGTVRTLDQVNGAIRLPPGLLSRSGWSVIDDSRSLVFDESSWLKPRHSPPEPNALDLYFFGYGSDYRPCLQDFCKVSGSIPLIPRWMLGNWWSRYWAYSDEELSQVVNDFRAHQIPLSVCIIDMDWHIVNNSHHEGWTGYTWNRTLFPDPPRFLGELRAQGLRSALNLHPRDGVHAHEEVYPYFARFMGIDPATKKPVEFECTDPKFVDGYFRFLHHPYEEDGIDFWWMDWQQGTASGLQGLDPLWWLNHLHFLDLGRNGTKRPVIFSRWGGWGNHRYPIGFSGDTMVSWESLRFQPYFTATAANVGYCYWSHDIGGHCEGTEDSELYARWVQFGALSPILRIHATCNPYQDRRPWMHDEEAFRVIRTFMQLRHALVPYLYALCRRTSLECLPLVRPMYYDHPQEEMAYALEGQYYLGTELLAAPYVTKQDPETRLSRQVVWLPSGDWFDFFSGEYVQGGVISSRYGTLEQTCLFARAGAIVPLANSGFKNGTDIPSCLDVHFFAGQDGHFDLYEDDGESTAYHNNHWSSTALSQKWDGAALTVSLSRAQGSLTHLPRSRTWSLHITGIAKPHTVVINMGGTQSLSDVSYDLSRERATITVKDVPVDADFTLTISTTLSRRDRTREKVEFMLRRFRAPSENKKRVSERLKAALERHDRLQEIALLLSVSQFKALCETILRAGYERITHQSDGHHSVLFWNAESTPLVRFYLMSKDCATYRGPIPRVFLLQLDRKENSEVHKYWPNRDWYGLVSWGEGLTENIHT